MVVGELASQGTGSRELELWQQSSEFTTYQRLGLTVVQFPYQCTRKQKFHPSLETFK